MKIYYDTEFIEDGRTIDLISIGIVADDGREYYCVNADMPWKRICESEWLVRNVVPSLPLRNRQSLDTCLAEGFTARRLSLLELDDTDITVRPRKVIRNEVREFLLGFDDFELWAWYAAYDHVVLAQLFGRMIDLPDGIPMWTNDLKQEAHRLGNPRVPQQIDGEHNALEDARHNKRIADFLAQYEAENGACGACR